MIFHDRRDAGRKLGLVIRNLESLRDRRQVVVLAIPRGGVPVGAEVARALDAPLDVWLAHKIGAPGNPEFAIGSISINGEVFFDRSSIDLLGIPEAYLKEEARIQAAELARRMTLFRGHAEPLNVRGKKVVLVDDGIATGATAFSALASLQRAGAARRILAVPVAPRETVPRLEAAADEAVILDTPHGFASVGQFYVHFEQVPDEEVVQLLAQARHGREPT